MKQLAIIADDLTGATDSGVQFARAGLSASVIFDLANLDTLTNDVTVVDTDTRAVARDAAYRKTKEAAEAVRAAGCPHLFKKVDSTLRGNVGTELDAMLDARPDVLAVVAPAFPQAGRTTRDGVHYLKGQPVHETEVGRDPKTPVPTSRIRELLAGQMEKPVAELSLAVVRGGREALAGRLASLRSEGVRAVVCDAETPEDLRAIADAGAALEGGVLWVGSAGLAEAIPAALGLAPSAAVADADGGPSGRPVLLVAGSLSGVTRGQVAHLLGSAPLHRVELDPAAAAAGGEAAAQEGERCRRELAQALDAGEDAAFVAGTSTEQVKEALQAGVAAGLSAVEVADRIAGALGEIAAGLIADKPLQGVVLTGGDTAKSVCRHGGYTGLTLLREVEAGIPLGRLVGPRPLLAVTKAGAFGTEEALAKAFAMLKGENHHEA
ncbi:membrane protein [Paenibacillus sp. J31TS4]|uniref:four-carbon acid sugar kinase family protein n=1 Tax=Paenibacillus sp. J31TS4 TaxID=2807195 RepID=UPI001B25A155|nr:four-carbon acid sugar kinase family protein [Paenibacillus sp. J31TS4]GIP40056.1 membrane protein [Paenibacillus sp. J31TS4]